MDRLIYASLAAMRGNMSRQATVSNNIANANTVGFRSEMSAARSLWLEGQGPESRATVREEVPGADMSAGTITATGRDLDIGLNGDALLAVQAADGSEAYSRRGDLKVTESGLLINGDGVPVLGESGPITLPPMDSISIAKDGQIWIVPQGGDPNNPQSVDRLKMVSPAGSRIAKALDGFFRPLDGEALPADPDARLMPKSLESSNVNVTAALVELIETSRSWETHVKMLTTAQDLDRSAAELMRLPE